MSEGKLYVLVSPTRKTIYVYRLRQSTDPPPACAPSRTDFGACHTVVDREATRLATIAQPASGFHLSMLHLSRDCGYFARRAQPDARIIEVEPDNPIVAGLQLCKRCTKAAALQVQELERLYGDATAHPKAEEPSSQQGVKS